MYGNEIFAYSHMVYMVFRCNGTLLLVYKFPLFPDPREGSRKSWRFTRSRPTISTRNTVKVDHSRGTRKDKEYNIIHPQTPKVLRRYVSPVSYLPVPAPNDTHLIPRETTQSFNPQRRFSSLVNGLMYLHGSDHNQAVTHPSFDLFPFP